MAIIGINISAGRIFLGGIGRDITIRNKTFSAIRAGCFYAGHRTFRAALQRIIIVIPWETIVGVSTSDILFRFDITIIISVRNFKSYADTVAINGCDFAQHATRTSNLVIAGNISKAIVIIIKILGSVRSTAFIKIRVECYCLTVAKTAEIIVPSRS